LGGAVVDISFAKIYYATRNTDVIDIPTVAFAMPERSLLSLPLLHIRKTPVKQAMLYKHDTGTSKLVELLA
jgi:hypothetical protein